MKSKIKFIIPLFLIVAIVFAPAKILSSFIPDNKDVVISGLDGSVWNGEINHLVVKEWVLNDVEYSTDVINLFSGKLGADVTIKKGDLIGDLKVLVKNEQNLLVENANISLQLSKLEDLISFKGVKLNGVIKTDGFDTEIVNKKFKKLVGEVAVSNASVTTFGKEWLLGNYVVDWTTDKNDSIKGVIKEGKNKLDLRGHISLTKSGLLEFRGSISTKIDKQIFAALSFFKDGKEKNGRQALKFKKQI